MARQPRGKCSGRFGRIVRKGRARGRVREEGTDLSHLDLARNGIVCRFAALTARAHIRWLGLIVLRMVQTI